jgi:hypothetical protein
VRPDREGSKPDSGVNRSAGDEWHGDALAEAEMALIGGMVIASLTDIMLYGHHVAQVVTPA